MKNKGFKLPSDFTENILGKYFKIDGKKITIELHYQTFAELIENDLGDDSVEKLNDALFDKLDELIELIPRKYSIEAIVKIDDFGNYAQDEAQTIVSQNFALKLYALALERRKKHLTSLSLLGGGVVLLLASYFLGKLNLPQIIFDIINISGTLLVWESANISLIEQSEDTKRATRFFKKFKDIRIVQA